MVDQKPKRYKKKKAQTVTAVQLELDTTGFAFEKWGHTQHCQAGDWLVNSEDDCYTVAHHTFVETYREVSPGRFLKHAAIHARKAESDGQIQTQEGTTDFKAGDYLIENPDDPIDTYAVSAEKFHQLYELVRD